jgi:hypothetical protein
MQSRENFVAAMGLSIAATGSVHHCGEAWTSVGECLHVCVTALDVHDVGSARSAYPVHPNLQHEANG